MTTIKAGARLPGRIHGIWLLSGRRREDGGRKNWRKEGRRGGGSGSSAAAQCRVHPLRCFPKKLFSYVNAALSSYKISRYVQSAIPVWRGGVPQPL